MTDALERVIRPIVEGQLRGFVKEHPSILAGVDWYKPRADKTTTFVNSAAKRIVRDLLCAENRERIERALFVIWENEESAVAIGAAADGAEADTSIGPASVSLVALADASEGGMADIVFGHPASRAFLPQVEWVRA